MDIGYKVVKEQEDKSLTSVFFYLGFPGVYYGINQISRPNPKCGPLSIFPDEETAKKYILNLAGKNSNLKTYRCKFTPSEKIILFYEGREGLIVFDPKDCRCDKSLKDILSQTLFADEVELLEEVT